MANKDTKKPITVTQQDFAPTTTPTTTTAVSTATNPITKLGLDDEQGFRAMALVPVRTGYAVVWVKLLGRHVVDAEILTEGVVPRHHAEDVFRVEASNRIINGGRDADEV